MLNSLLRVLGGVLELHDDLGLVGGFRYGLNFEAQVATVRGFGGHELCFDAHELCLGPSQALPQCNNGLSYAVPRKMATLALPSEVFHVLSQHMQTCSLSLLNFQAQDTLELKCRLGFKKV